MILQTSMLLPELQVDVQYMSGEKLALAFIYSSLTFLLS